MPTVRLSPKAVQVDDLNYHFQDADAADDFEACVALNDPAHCQKMAGNRVVSVVKAVLHEPQVQSDPS